MTTSTELIIPELAESKKLALITPESALAVRTAYLPLFATFLELEKEAKEIAINAPAAAKILRLKLTKVRTSADRSRKALGEEARRYKEACDEVYNILEDRLKPVEERLRAIEEAEKRAAAEKAAKLKEARVAELTPHAAVTATDVSFYDLANMPEGQYVQLLASVKASAEARIAEVKKAESDRLAAEAAKEAERIRLAEENRKLAAEAAERQKALDAERAKAEEARKKAAAEVEKVRKENEAKLEAERKKAADEAARVKKIADEKAAKEKSDREAIEKAAQAKRDADAKKLADERAATETRLRREKEASEREAKRLLDEAKAREDAEKAQKAKEVEEAQKAAAAPTKNKLIEFAKAIRALPVPILTSHKVLGAKLIDQTSKFAQWVENESAKIK